MIYDVLRCEAKDESREQQVEDTKEEGELFACANDLCGLPG